MTKYCRILAHPISRRARLSDGSRGLSKRSPRWHDAAARLHQQFEMRQQVEAAGGNVDVFAAIHALDLPLLMRSLQGQLGAYLSDPDPGVLVTTKRPMSIQRFTAAHELGHFRLKHQPSLDDESILRRMPIQPLPGDDFQEVEADVFAVEFMMPRWLIAWHAARQSWTVSEFRRPNVVYQLSLRIGASYEATCWTLVRYNFIQSDTKRSRPECFAAYNA